MRLTSLIRIGIGRSCAAALVVVGICGSAEAGEADCLKPFLSDIVKDLNAESARRLYRKFSRFNPEAQAGVVSILGAELPPGFDFGPDTIDDILDHFGGGALRENPLQTDEALFAVIGGLTEQGADGVLRMRSGVEATVRNLADGSFSTAQGAAFDLFIARKAAGEGADYSRVISFEKEIPVGGRTRRLDVVEACVGCPPNLPGIHHENKNLLAPIFASADELANPPMSGGRFIYSDFKLTNLADEFARDIVLHQGAEGVAAPFQYYRLNFREFTNTPEQISILKQVLAKQFDAQFVTDAIQDATRRAALRDAFLGSFDSIVTFHP